MGDDTEWQLEFCAGYLVPISKGKSEDEILNSMQGSVVGLSASLRSYFLPMLIVATDEYRVDVLFESDDRSHPIRDLLQQVAFGDTAAREQSSKRLAAQLASVTDKRSDEGLLIVLLGCQPELRRIAIWKFPTDESIRATFASGGLTIELIQDAFSRDSKYFKAAVFEGSTHSSFWTGKVEDKQAASRITKVSDLWLEGFLQAKIELKDEVASRTAGDGLRQTIDRMEDQELREQVIATVISLRNQDGETITYGEIARRLPPDTRQIFLSSIKDGRTDIPFSLRANVLEAATRVRIILLDNGFSVRGPAQLFEVADSPVRIEQLNDNQVEITVRGTRIHDKLGVR